MNVTAEEFFASYEGKLLKITPKDGIPYHTVLYKVMDDGDAGSPFARYISGGWVREPLAFVKDRSGSLTIIGITPSQVEAVEIVANL